MRNSTYIYDDNVWLMISTGFVYLMTPALSCFYGGLVGNKNFLNQLFLSIICMAIIPVQWCLFGYSFVFGPGNSAFGSFQYSLYQQARLVGIEEENIDIINAPTVVSLSFAEFQSTFAIVTPALISGAVVGRMKLLPYMLFIFLWSTFCYDPLARWVIYRGGWLHKMGVIDYAGGLVVHTASGVSALITAIILGSHANLGADTTTTVQTNLSFTVLGTGLLWVGWMGFNGGAAISAGGIASLAIVNTNIAAAGSIIIWIILDFIADRVKRIDNNFISISGLCSATVVGLVTITPSAGCVQPGYALLIGIIGGFTVYLFLAGGLIGTISAGLFSQHDVNSNIENGVFYGRPIQLWYQLVGALITCAYSAMCTAVILLSMHFTIGIRLNSADQIRGVDTVAHGSIDEDHRQKLKQLKIPGMKKNIDKNQSVTATHVC